MQTSVYFFDGLEQDSIKKISKKKSSWCSDESKALAESSESPPM